MSLDTNKAYFINQRDVVLRMQPLEKTSKNAANHLLLGDYLRYLGTTDGDWAKVKCRGDEGWLKTDWFSEQRLLEINFIDIGQGDGCHIVTPDDEVILIDAGEGEGFTGQGGDNMYRFITWRYNLRCRDDGKPPFDIEHAVMTHPDLDHYYGFINLFKHPKLNFKTISHNGIVERPLGGASQSSFLYDLGRKVPPTPRQKVYHLWDTVRTHQDMIEVLDAHPNSQKFYLSTLRAARDNNPQVQFKFVDQSQKFFAAYNQNNDLQMEVLGPITEDIEFNGQTKDCLIKLGNEGETKNGHSVIFKLRYGKLKVLLGGDLNAKSQDYIAQYYSGIQTKMSDLEDEIRDIREDLISQNLTIDERKAMEQRLDEHRKLLDLIISKTRGVFQADIAKACHHGASDVLDSFLQAINPIATVISSGDEESHSHPRPDALGAFGKASRGHRPLIFSTELARSSVEFSYPIKFYQKLKDMEAKKDAATTQAKKDEIQQDMEQLRDSNVAKYGMITIRTDGERVIIAQKLEEERSPGQKWDIYDLFWNDKLQEYEYRKGKGH
ncbi:ComEC/Rec2 family competence protein [Marinicella meishanensis]|uniref:ComEC/Rec2 family competence protein n=1 Tax=Marinicella meishanensis TaxID=2873263 RepID=UPI001CC1627F|nr:MBL fold metallo-hydrolase [Marinicella sp. NBU2979]